MEAFMKKYCAKHRITLSDDPGREDENESSSAAATSTISFEHKVELAENIRKVNHELLAEVVKTVEEQCKAAIEEIDSDRIQIKVDSLDKSTFDKLSALVQGEEAHALKKLKS